MLPQNFVIVDSRKKSASLIAMVRCGSKFDFIAFLSVYIEGLMEKSIRPLFFSSLPFFTCGDGCFLAGLTWCASALGKGQGRYFVEKPRMALSLAWAFKERHLF